LFFTARIERAPLYRGGSASKKNGLPAPSHPSEAARCASTEDHQAPSPPLSASSRTTRLARGSLHLSCDRDLRYRTCVVEHSFICPFCGEEISMVLNLSVRRYTYVEDCEVCCNPLEISYTVEDDSLTHFEAKSLE
jgi:hypothetical protein